jgi:hypothetical protein
VHGGDHDGHVDPSGHGFGLDIVTAASDRFGLRWEEATVAWFEIDLDPFERA